MAGHTKEPWEFDPKRGYIFQRRDPLTIYVIANMESGDDDNAHRIVECVNALAGIPDPAAYVAAFKGLREALVVVSLLAGDRLLSEDGVQMVKAALSAARTAMGGSNG